MPQYTTARIAILTIFVLRLLAIRFGIRSKPLPGFRDYWDRPEGERG